MEVIYYCGLPVTFTPAVPLSPTTPWNMINNAQSKLYSSPARSCWGLWWSLLCLWLATYILGSSSSVSKSAEEGDGFTHNSPKANQWSVAALRVIRLWLVVGLVRRSIGGVKLLADSWELKNSLWSVGRGVIKLETELERQERWV